MTEKTVTIKLNEELVIGLNSILGIFMDNVGELENLTRESLQAEYGYAKYLKGIIGCNLCKYYGKERDYRGCTKCCNGSCCNLEVKE